MFVLLKGCSNNFDPDILLPATYHHQTHCHRQCHPYSTWTNDSSAYSYSTAGQYGISKPIGCWSHILSASSTLFIQQCFPWYHFSTSNKALYRRMSTEVNAFITDDADCLSWCKIRNANSCEEYSFSLRHLSMTPSLAENGWLIHEKMQISRCHSMHHW